MTQYDNEPGPDAGQAPPPGGMAPSPPPPPPGLYPEPPAPPAPQPAPPAPPASPAAAAAPAAVAPTAPAAVAAKPKRRLGIILAVVTLLLLCALGGCAVLLFGSGADDSETIGQAEAHYSAAMSAVESATVALDGISVADPAAPASVAAVEQATKALRTGRDELAASRASIEQLDESEGRSDYLGSLEQATLALDGLEDLVAYMNTASGMAGKMSEAGKTASQATDDLNAAIFAGNSNNYSAMRAKAEAAAAGFTKAATLFDEAHKLDSSAGLDRAAEYARARIKQAQVVVTMAADGQARRVNEYNRGIERMKNLGATADKIGEPAIVSDPNWAENRLSAINEAVTAAGTKADELHASALEALGYTQ